MRNKGSSNFFESGEIEENSDQYSQSIHSIQQQESQFSHTRTSTTFSAIANLSNGLVGAGTLSYAYSFHCCGFFSAILISILTVILTIYTLRILSVLSFNKYGGIRSYELCCEIHLGKGWRIICQLAIIFYSTGMLCTYLVIIGQFIKVPLDAWMEIGDDNFFWTNEKVIIVFFSILFIYPLSLLREIKFLGFTSFLSILSAFYLTAFIIVSAFLSLFGSGNNNSLSTLNSLNNENGFLRMFVANPLLVFIQTKLYFGFYPLYFLGISIVIMGYNTHQLLFPVSYELKNGSTKKTFIVIIFSVIIFTSVFLGNGIFGYILFGESIGDNVLNNFDGSNLFANIGRIAMGITCMFSFPLMSYSSRLAIISLLFGTDSKKLSTFKYLSLQTVYFVIILIIALLIPSISISFGIVGAVGGSTLIFGIPAVLVLKVYVKLSKNKKQKILYLCIGFFLLIIFMLCLITGVIASILQIMESYINPK